MSSSAHSSRSVWRQILLISSVVVLVPCVLLQRPHSMLHRSSCSSAQNRLRWRSHYGRCCFCCCLGQDSARTVRSRCTNEKLLTTRRIGTVWIAAGSVAAPLPFACADAAAARTPGCAPSSTSHLHCEVRDARPAIVVPAAVARCSSQSESARALRSQVTSQRTRDTSCTNRKVKDGMRTLGVHAEFGCNAKACLSSGAAKS